MRRDTPCDLDGICPYEDFHSGYIGSCEYWCGEEEPEDYPELWEEELEDSSYPTDISYFAETEDDYYGGGI